MNRKMIAPCVIAFLVCFYCFMVIGAWLGIWSYHFYDMWDYVFLIFPLVGAGIMLAVTKERVEEIRSGEEDDLSEY